MALSAWQATIVNESGDVIPSASIEVIDKGTGLAATIYSNSGGASLGNPFPANAGGFGRFYANAGTYNITASDSGSGFSETWNDVRLGDAQAKDTGTGSSQVPTNANLSAAVCGTASFSGDVYTFTPVGAGFRPLQAGMYVSFNLPSGSANTTTTPDIDYNGSTYVIKWIDGSALVADDLDETYNKQPILFYFDGTDMLIASDISGSNAAGDWIRKASGGQNCTRTYGQLWPVGGTTISIGISKSFVSADFSPNVSWGASTGAAGSGLEKIGLQPNGTSNVSLTIVMNSSDTRDVYIQATGRWY